MEHVHPKKGGKRWRDAHCGKETKLMVVVDGQGMPIGLKLTSATPHESTLIESTLDTIRVLPAKAKDDLARDFRA